MAEPPTVNAAGADSVPAHVTALGVGTGVGDGAGCEAGDEARPDDAALTGAAGAVGAAVAIGAAAYSTTSILNTDIFGIWLDVMAPRLNIATATKNE